MLKITRANFLPIEKSDFPEICERKGIGHPDSVCDAVADACSRALCAYYIIIMLIKQHSLVEPQSLYLVEE
jgi:S-adenosylmethionine synthetase